jgi:hypothetical protein
VNEERESDVPAACRLVLRRANGRYVRAWPARSRYAAKRLRRELEETYDPTYLLVIEPLERVT